MIYPIINNLLEEEQEIEREIIEEDCLYGLPPAEGDIDDLRDYHPGDWTINRYFELRNTNKIPPENTR